MNTYIDPLREPTNSRSRIRQARQQEVSALYEATFERRLDVANTKTGNISNTTTGKYAPPSPISTAARLCGKPVNVSGQTVDGKDTAISRLLHGDFYTVRGLGVGEIHSKPEGKLMRFRSAGPPRDIRRTVGTETPHCPLPTEATWIPPPPVDQVQYEDERLSEDEAPWHVSRPTTGGRLWGGRPQTGNKRPTSSASTFRNPTYSSSRKNLDAPQRQLQQAASTTTPVGLRNAPRVNPYESALQKQNAHNPGQAAVVSRLELERIYDIANRKEYHAPRSARAGYYPKDSIELS